MRLDLLFVALLLLSRASIPAHAELNASSPSFNAAETRMIDRNELLRAIVEGDPWLVRRILDLVAQENPKVSAEPSAAALDGIDRSGNPDIASSARSAAGSVEWIELLRRARTEKEELQNRAEGTERSAQGSVEFFEMLRRAQGAKGALK